MSLRLYMDEHIPAGIASRLRARGIDVLTVQEDGWGGTPDESVLEHASAIERAVFTNDEDFLRITAARLRRGAPFYCVFFAKQSIADTLVYAEWLEMYARLAEPEECRNRLIYIP